MSTKCWKIESTRKVHEQNREPRTEPIHVQSINNTTMEAKIYNGKKYSLSINGVGKTG